MTHTVIVPSNLVLEPTILFANSLQDLPDADSYIFDFAGVQRIEPFAMLALGSEIRRCRTRKQECRFTAINFGHCQYAARMGFFQSFGLNHGEPTGQSGGANFLPIQIYNAQQLRDEASADKLAPAKYLEGMAERMSEILTRSDSGKLFDTIVYSIREVLRNIIEHSQTDRFGLCAQHWPSQNKVSLAILDRGLGIRQTLASNPYLTIENDWEALAYAIQPGISGTAFKGAYRDPDDAWANSGYGLYMTSKICKEGGSFFITSGSNGIYLSENKQRVLETPFQGTALNLTLNTDRVMDLESMLERFRKEAKSQGAEKPSPSSTGLTKSMRS
jgi:hypothetical protein